MRCVLALGGPAVPPGAVCAGIPALGPPCREAAGCQDPVGFPSGPRRAPTWHRYVWEKDGAPLGTESGPRLRLDEAGTLHISQTWSGDIGTYTCKVLSAGGNDSRSAHLRVR